MGLRFAPRTPSTDQMAVPGVWVQPVRPDGPAPASSRMTGQPL